MRTDRVQPIQARVFDESRRGCGGSCRPGPTRSAQNMPARVDAAILRQRIEALSVFGRSSGGTFADGVSRVAYSDADVAGRRYMIGLMRAAGLEPRIDQAGNIFGRRAGSDSSVPPILFGSHIDSVPSGGNFDGDLGSFAALGVIEALAARKSSHAPLPGDGRVVGRRRRGIQPRIGRQPHSRR